MEEISHLFGMFLSAVVTGSAALTNPARPLTHRHPDETMAAQDLKALEAPFLRMLDEHHGIIKKICYAYARTKSDREDLHQEIVYRLWHAYPSFDGESKISTWMYTIAVRTAILPFRRGVVKIESQERLPEKPVEDDSPYWMDDRLYRVFQQLGNFEKGVFLLMMEGFQEKEIAIMVGMGERSLSSRISRVRKTLEKL